MISKCQRRQGARGEYWWICNHCNQAWNERNTGPHWRPHDCPERKAETGTEAVRDKHNHDGR